MSTAERLRQQGRELGLSEGLYRSLHQLLQLKFTEIPEWALTRLAAGQVDDLKRWTTRVLTAETIDDIFAD